MIAGPYSKSHPKQFRRLVEWSVIGLMFLAGVTAIGEAKNALLREIGAQEPTKATKPLPRAKSALREAPITGVRGFLASVTAFSDVECGSDWCDRHEPKDGQVALNYSKFGRVSKVYVPAFDKTYRVVGTTDGKSDLDIWFGEDQEAALEFGRKTLLINLIP